MGGVPFKLICSRNLLDMWQSSINENSKAARRTGYVYEELYLWHHSGNISFDHWTQPGEHWENPETKRRFNNLLEVTKLKSVLQPIKARKATVEEVTRFHDSDYVSRIEQLSKGEGGDAGELARFFTGGYDIALLSAGGVLVAVESILSNQVDNAYCLVRPPGHHAERDKGRGFCIFNNIALGALHCKALRNPDYRVAIIDFDVHHGNGTQQAFWDDPTVLFISIHQDNNYPQNSGAIHEIGGPKALKSTINLPLPPGSGSGAYEYAFNKVVLPAISKFMPDFIMVSAGYDASYADPLGSMMLSSEAYGNMAGQLIATAENLCGGRILFAHEGGYSKDYVPFCGLAVVETLCGLKSGVQDPNLSEVKAWGYQTLQPHQAALIDAVTVLAGLGGSDDDGSVADVGEEIKGLGEKDRIILLTIQALLESVDDVSRVEMLKTLNM